MQLPNQQTTIILFAIFTISFLANLLVLSQNQLLPGQDAAYYLRGTESLLKNKKMPGSLLEWPPIFFFASALFSVFFGTVAGIKIAAALFAALLGMGVFLLARQLFKNNETSLIATVFVLVAPTQMRLLNGFWKTETALFFLALFLFFFLKAQGKQKNKNLLFALAMLALTFLSHKLLGFFALLLLICFVFFESAFEKKISKHSKNTVIVFVAASAIVLLLLLTGQKNFDDFFSFFGLVNALSSNSANASLFQYYSALLFSAFFGALFCFFNAKREHLFLLSWFFLSLFLAMPLATGDNYWRFAFLLSLPFGLLSAAFYQDTKKILGSLNSIIVCALIALLAINSSIALAQQTQPIFSQQELAELQSLMDDSNNTLLFARGPSLEWLKYFGAQAQQAGTNFFAGAKTEKAFLVVDKQRLMLDFSGSEKQLGFFSIIKDYKRFALLSVKQEANYSPQQLPVAEKRLLFSNPVFLFFWPAELFNLFNSAIVSFLRAVIGLPLSIAFIALLLSRLKRFEKKKHFFFAATIIIAFFVFLAAMAK